MTTKRAGRVGNGIETAIARTCFVMTLIAGSWHAVAHADPADAKKEPTAKAPERLIGVAPPGPRCGSRRGCAFRHSDRGAGRSRSAQQDARRVAEIDHRQSRPDQTGSRGAPSGPERPGRYFVGHQAGKVPFRAVLRRRSSQQNRTDLLYRAQDHQRGDHGTDHRLDQVAGGRRCCDASGAVERSLGGRHATIAAAVEGYRRRSHLGTAQACRCAGGQGRSGCRGRDARQPTASRSGRRTDHHAAAATPGDLGDRTEDPDGGMEGNAPGDRQVWRSQGGLSARRGRRQCVRRSVPGTCQLPVPGWNCG